MPDLLKVKPFRGEQVAAGVVVFTTFVVLLLERFTTDWAAGVRLLVAAAAAAFVLALAWSTPVDGEAPRAYQSVLYIAGSLLWAAGVAELSRALHGHGAGAATWELLLAGAMPAAFTLRRASAIGTLLAAVAWGGAVLALVNWVFSPHGVKTDEYVLVGLTVVFVVLATGQRDGRPRHAVQLVNAAGLGTLALSSLLFLAGAVRLVVSRLGEPGDGAAIAHTAWGWELFVIVMAFGLIAYASVERAPGPAYLGAFNLIAFVVLATDATHPSLVGWPIVLALAAGFMLVLGLRPTRPEPPEPPGVPREPPPPTALRP